MERRIKELCRELMASQDPDRIEEIGNELRYAIHQHVENLRLEVTALPALDTALLKAA